MRHGQGAGAGLAVSAVEAKGKHGAESSVARATVEARPRFASRWASAHVCGAMTDATEVTDLLKRAVGGGRDVFDRLYPAVYDELRRVARRLLAGERPDRTLDTTELVHEAYLRLVDQTRATYADQCHFRAVAAQAMRRILVDRARRRDRIKRGGGARAVSLDEVDVVARLDPDSDLEALDDALRRLAEADPVKARVVELRFFGGLTIDETAELLGVSPMTVKRDWAVARAWLYRELTG